MPQIWLKYNWQVKIEDSNKTYKSYMDKSVELRRRLKEERLYEIAHSSDVYRMGAGTGSI